MSKKHHRVFVRLAKGLSIYVQKDIKRAQFRSGIIAFINLKNPQSALGLAKGASRYELLLTEPGSGIARCVSVLAQLPSTNTVKSKESFDSRSDEGVGGH